MHLLFHMWLIVNEEIRFLKHKHVVIYTEETLWEFKPVKRVVQNIKLVLTMSDLEGQFFIFNPIFSLCFKSVLSKVVLSFIC